MTYRARQHGAAITEVPIRFVDREAGESKMSSVIVVEALGLVTWWGLGRIVPGAAARPGRRAPAAARDAGAAATGATGAARRGRPRRTEDPVRSA